MVGVIITVTKFCRTISPCLPRDVLHTHSQLAEMPIALPLARARRGRISGTYTQGTQLALAPKISMYRKKNAIDALEVPFCLMLKSTAINNMQTERPADPNIMGFLRPRRSRKIAGMMLPAQCQIQAMTSRTVLPIGNIRLTKPPMSKARLASTPTLNWSADGT